MSVEAPHLINSLERVHVGAVKLEILVDSVVARSPVVEHEVGPIILYSVRYRPDALYTTGGQGETLVPPHTRGSVSLYSPYVRMACRSSVVGPYW